MNVIVSYYKGDCVYMCSVVVGTYPTLFIPGSVSTGVTHPKKLKLGKKLWSPQAPHAEKKSEQLSHLSLFPFLFLYRSLSSFSLIFTSFFLPLNLLFLIRSTN